MNAGWFYDFLEKVAVSGEKPPLTYFGDLAMSFTNVCHCDRCDKEITGNSAVVNYEGMEGLSQFTAKLDLCNDCFSDFLDWVDNPEPTKLGPVERVARREDSEQVKLGPVERVAKREDGK